MNMFSKYYGGNSNGEIQEGITKIGGLSVPIGLVLNSRNNDNNHNKYFSKYNENIVTDENDDDIIGGSRNEKDVYDIKEIDSKNMDELFNMVCKTHDKMQSRKNIKNKIRITKKI